jgi:hypothetical protein
MKSIELRKTRKKLPIKKVYTRKDYSSNDGMLVSVWGPSLWHYLHTMSFNYPVNPTCEDKANYREFILNLKNVLPCGKCRMNLRKNFKKLPLKMKDMSSRDAFSRYIYKLHEVINKMLKKKSGLSYEDVRERYEHFRARCTKPTAEIQKDIKEWDKNNKDETGCVEPLYGEKSKCILQIVPQETKCETLRIDNKCIKQKLIIHEK